MANYTPVNSDATNVAQRTIDRLATVTGIAGLQNPVDLNTTTGGQLVAIADSYLNCIGFQAQDFGNLSTNNTTSTTYATLSSYTFSAPVAKTYTVHCDVTLFTSSAGGNGYLQLVINGHTGPEYQVDRVASGQRFQTHLMFAAACAQGNNTITLQWRVSVGTTNYQVDSQCYRNFIISG